MERFVRILLASGAALGIAAVILAVAGQTAAGLALLAVGIADVVIALLLRARGGH